ncbi:hypothetical protein HDU80_005917 [Chytriomyces hyalinus]|nr:hypothetical protein HDU80_005917 [Chytriomyces hyalinus]
MQMMVDADVSGLTQPQAPNWEVLPAKGRLYIKVIEARSLWTPNVLAVPGLPLRARRPYVVAEFEMNEFITKEAIETNTFGPQEIANAIEEERLNYDNAEEFSGVRNTCPGVWMSPVWRHEASFDVSQPESELTISVWDRNDTSDSNEEFLGMLKIITPMIDGKVYDHWFRLMPRQWNEKVRGDIRIQLMFKTVEGKRLCAEDFKLLKLVGKGSFGKVMLVKKADTGRVYAMKILNKKDIVKRQEIAHTMSERNVLIHNAPCAFLVSLKFSFQTPEKLYLVTDYLSGGELFYHLQRQGCFPEALSKFYTCELICALEYLHLNHIAYRDLKPENVLLDSQGHIALTDFGLCKENMSQNQLTNTFCGTAAYLAPEVILAEGYGKSVDWWSLGILFYEMVMGIPPFYNENVNLMYRKILHNQLLFEAGQFSAQAELFASSLLDRNPQTRLGSGPSDALELKQHPYFADVDWSRLERKLVMPPYKPLVESESDASYFDPVFTTMMPADSLPNNSQPLSTFIQTQFQGFTWTPEKFPSSMRSIRLED